MVYAFREMNDETLIELVRINPVLYDTSHPKYVNRILKNNIWNSIGHVLSEDGTLCRSRWNNIRDQFRKSLKKAALKPNQVRKYKYCSQLEFLQQHLNDRETLEPMDDVPKIEDSAGSTEEQKEILDLKVDEDHNDSNTIQSGAFSPAVSMRNDPSPFQQPFPLKPAPNFYYDQQPTHQVDAFLAGIAPTLKYLDPIALNMAKTEIFSIVQKYELQMLKDENDA